MPYHATVLSLSDDPEELEKAYQAAVKAGEQNAFGKAIEEGYAAAPGNLLYAAWFHRLKQTAAQAKGFAVAWAWAIPLAVLTGLVFWWLSDYSRFTIVMQARTPGGTARELMPTLALLAAPIAALSVLCYLTIVGRTRWYLSVLAGVVLLAAGAYVLVFYPRAGSRPFQEQYLTLMMAHLPLLSWAAVGAILVFGRGDPANRFAFLIKSLEVFILGGLFVIAGGLFTGITVGLFTALGVDFPPLVWRLFSAGGGGLIPVMAVATAYNPRVAPSEQEFSEGLSRTIAVLMRILLPLTLLVLVVYLAFIPFSFRAPFENRDVLIIYNGMLFAVVALLAGATPVTEAGASAQLGRWLRRGIVAVAALALLVSLYALSAIVYRTMLDRITPNRLAMVGWNVINIGLLLALLWSQLRADSERWVAGVYKAYSFGTVTYVAWTLAMIIVLPWLFGIRQGAMGSLPSAVQGIVY